MNSAPILAEILSADLPLLTAFRAAAARGMVLQSSATHSILAPRLLPGFERIYGGGTRIEQPKEAA